MVSLVVKRTNKKIVQGLVYKKSAMAGINVFAAVKLDLATESGNFMHNAKILLLISMEVISMIENLRKLGIKVPRFLARVFSQLQIENDD
jgi:phage-related holin